MTLARHHRASVDVLAMETPTMRWILPSLVALTLAAGTLRADPESPPTPGDIAEWIRAGTEADLERAAQASERLDAVALRQVIA